MSKKIQLSNYFMLNYLKLPIISTFDELSNEIGVSKKLLYLLTSEEIANYKVKEIQKKKKGKRKIYIPNYSLKIVQRWVLKEILEKIETTDEAMAFKIGKDFGIKSNAEKHKNNIYILKMDLKDFFHSISEKDVFFIFKNIGYNNLIATMLTKLCTTEGVLPQGAVTSPYISNLICNSIDNLIKKYSGKKDVTYTRYADDLIFSCNNLSMLKRMIKGITGIIEMKNFKVNEDKTKILTPGMRKNITGVIVNTNEVRAKKNLKKKVRAILHTMITSGDYTEKEKLKGYISFISFIEENYEEKLREYIGKLGIKISTDNELVKIYNSNKLIKNQEELKFSSFSIEDIYDSNPHILDNLLNSK